jgi:Arc/MetJ family transcription regulator
VATRPNFDYLRIKLREIDDDVSAAALQALGPEELDLLRAEAGRAVERHRGRVDDDALEDARGRYTLQRARERFDLPRVCLI